jgi:hypothetical protein
VWRGFYFCRSVYDFAIRSLSLTLGASCEARSVLSVCKCNDTHVLDKTFTSRLIGPNWGSTDKRTTESWFYRQPNAANRTNKSAIVMNQIWSIRSMAKHFDRNNNILGPLKMFITQNILAANFLAQPNHHPSLTWHFEGTSKVPVLRYEIKNVDAEHNFVKIYFLIAIFKDIFAYHDLLITTFKRYT